MAIRESVIIAALLHDIGKFYQRTGLPCTGYEGFTEQDYGKNGAHAKWSASFIVNHLPERWREAAGLVFYHHNAQSNDQKIIARADRISAGMEREHRELTERGDIHFDRQTSLLEQIYLPEDESDQRLEKTRYYAYRLQPLKISEGILFPERLPRTPLTNEYENLWHEFVDKVSLLPKASFSAFLETLYFLLYKYTWCIPSSVYVDYPDIPLFDHLRVTGAIAACLYDNSSKEDFNFIEGDLSGIQNFIYNVPSPAEAQTGMARRLRGKSFYLHLLTRSLSLFYLERLSLPITNLLWCSGGHFAILAPENEQTKKSLEEASEIAEGFMWNKFRGDLALITGQVKASSQDLLRFNTLVERMGQELALQKSRKFPYSLIKKQSWKFTMQKKVCPLCQRDAEDLEEMVEEDGETRPLCKECQEYEEIGRLIPQPHTKAIARVKRPDKNKKGIINFENLDVAWSLRPESEDEILALYTIEPQLDFIKSMVEYSTGFEVVARYVAMRDDKILDFHKLSELAKGAQYLGMLRMDVDDLGSIFRFGMEESDRTITRLTSISRTLELFFSGYLNALAKGREVYLGYAGGDDLFLVGPWDRVVEMALDIHDKFDQYCCRNSKNLHISGGIHLCKGKFPIGRAANYAGDSLDNVAKMSKNTTNFKDTYKNSLSLFQRKIPWEVMYKIKQIADEVIIPAIETEDPEKKLARRFLYFLLNLYHQHFDEEEGREELAMWAKLLYNLKRNVKDEELASKLESTIVELKYYIPVLTGYAALKTRKFDEG